jgi:hypothetical protein
MFMSMGRKKAKSGVEKGQMLTYKKKGLSSREIARRIERSPFVVNNFLKLGILTALRSSLDVHVNLHLGKR